MEQGAPIGIETQSNGFDGGILWAVLAACRAPRFKIAWSEGGEVLGGVCEGPTGRIWGLLVCGFGTGLRGRVPCWAPMNPIILESVRLIMGRLLELLKTTQEVHVYCGRWAVTLLGKQEPGFALQRIIGAVVHLGPVNEHNLVGILF